MHKKKIKKKDKDFRLWYLEQERNFYKFVRDFAGLFEMIFLLMVLIVFITEIIILIIIPNFPSVVSFVGIGTVGILSLVLLAITRAFLRCFDFREVF